MAKLNVSIEGVRYNLFNDLYYRMIRTSWSRFFLTASLIYLIINFLFALLYFYSPAEISNTNSNSLWDAFVFSFQTSSTIGYGYYLPKNDPAHFLVIIDAMTGIFYAAIITGMAFAKFAKPSAKIIFTNNIIIATFDSVPTLMFRIANSRDTHIIDASVKVGALIPYVSKEGHQIRRTCNLKLMNTENPTFLLTWTVMHPIDTESPLYGLTLDEIKEKRISFSTSFTGIDKVLTQTVHSNHIYLAKDLLKAKKFKDVLKHDQEDSYQLNLDNFHSIED
ncbi:ion channel [Halobacteriovorax sp. XZX-3]|uniref:ion channel n=1 Tax=unclassified Halobacteriovorax TaxID=2639665 RepID=UPI00371F96E3